MWDKRWFRTAGLVAALACGGGSDMMAPGGGGSLPSGSAEVTIQDFAFSPVNVTIKVGAAVRWTNHGPSTHTTTSDTDVWDSGQLSSSNGQFQRTFMQPGTFPYHCTNHPPSLYPTFTGTVVVTQ